MMRDLARTRFPSRNAGLPRSTWTPVAAPRTPGTLPVKMPHPIPPPPYRPQTVAKPVQLKMPAPPPVYRPQAASGNNPRVPPARHPGLAKAVSIQAKMEQARIRLNPPPVYRPQMAQSHGVVSRKPGPQPFPPVARPAAPLPAALRTVQRWVDLKKAKITENGRYVVDPSNPTILYSVSGAAPPEPASLYTRGKDKGYWNETPVKLNSWKPNVRFLSRAEAGAEPVLEKPGTYQYKTSGMLGIKSTTTFSINQLKQEVEDPDPGLDRGPLVGALGKNDCNIWATTLQNLIAEEKGSYYQETRGHQEPRVVRVQSDVTPSHTKVQVGDRMKHMFVGSLDCNYHAATVVAKDGKSLVTLEGNVVLDLTRPQFHIHNGLAGFAEEGIQDKLGDKMEVIPLTSLTSESVRDERETREDRYQRFSDINPSIWKEYENLNYSYRGRLIGDIGVTSTAEKRRRDQRFQQILSEIETHTLDTATYTSFPPIE